MKLFYILFLFTACLLISEGANIRIVNGQQARAHSRPYMAFIVLTNSTWSSLCGGSLIKENWVLTAAHCQVPNGKATVYLGAHSANLNDNGIQFCEGVKQHIHPKYRENIAANDIQLMELSKSATLNKEVQLLTLPETYEDVKIGTVCEMAGWGETENKTRANALREVKVSTINRTDCQNRVSLKEKNVNIAENKMCTSVGEKGENACRGDSGGPLICDGVFRGIISFGSEICETSNGVTVYARLTEEYIAWINKTIGK